MLIDTASLGIAAASLLLVIALAAGLGCALRLAGGVAGRGGRRRGGACMGLAYIGRESLGHREATVQRPRDESGQDSRAARTRRLHRAGFGWGR